MAFGIPNTPGALKLHLGGNQKEAFHLPHLGLHIELAPHMPHFGAEGKMKLGYKGLKPLALHLASIKIKGVPKF